MATYDARDCDYFEADDSTASYTFQYTETFGHYTHKAADHAGDSLVIDSLMQHFSKKEELC